MTVTKICNKGVEKLAMDIIRSMTIQNFIPDYVVGITRGGLHPALLISNYFDVPMETLKVSFRDHPNTESNCWMAEDAFGYSDNLNSTATPKKILIVDDINDTGATFNWIKSDWQDSCLPHNEERWNNVWHNNVKFAVLVNNEASSFKQIDFAGSLINKAETNEWIEFPWEKWWM